MAGPPEADRPTHKTDWSWSALRFILAFFRISVPAVRLDESWKVRRRLAHSLSTGCTTEVDDGGAAVAALTTPVVDGKLGKTEGTYASVRVVVVVVAHSRQSETAARMLLLEDEW
jgi:hypothetical protein